MIIKILLLRNTIVHELSKFCISILRNQKEEKVAEFTSKDGKHFQMTRRYVTYRPAVSDVRIIFTTCKTNSQILNGVQKHSIEKIR